VKHKRLKLDSYLFAAVIEACAKGKLWQRALKLLEEMEEEGVESSAVTYR